MASRSSSELKFKSLQKLTVEETCKLLYSLNMGIYIEKFRKYNIDGLSLSACDSTSELEEFGIDDESLAISFLATLGDYRKTGVPVSNFSTTQNKLEDIIIREELSPAGVSKGKKTIAFCEDTVSIEVNFKVHSL